MKREEKKGRLKKLFDRNIILGIILMILIFGISVGVTGLLTLIRKDITELCTAAGAIISLLIFEHIYKGEYLGSVKGGNVKTAIRLAAFMLIYYCFIIFQTTIIDEWTFPSYTYFFKAISAGVAEEILFRGFLMSYFFRFKKEKKDIPLILITCSVLFGFIHIFNIFAGGGVGITIIQVYCTIGLGALFGAIYMRGGNIIVAMIAHGLTDYLCFMDLTQLNENGTIKAAVSWSNYVDIIICTCLFILSLYLVRDAKRDEIKELWDRKWCR